MFKYVLLAFLCLGALQVSAQETIAQRYARILKEKRDSVENNTNLIRKTTMARVGTASDSFAKAVYDSLLLKAVGVDGQRLADSIDSVQAWVDGNYVAKADSDLYQTVWYGEHSYFKIAAANDTAAALRGLANGKVGISDTATMLAAYARLKALADTAAAIRAAMPSVTGKVNYTDTAAMLAPYVLGNRLTDTAAALRAMSNARVKYTDTATMLSGYVLSNRFTDSIALTVKKRDSLLLYATPKNVKDSAVSVRAAIPTNNNQLTNGAGYITSTGVVYTTSVQTLTNKRITFRVTGGSTFTTSVAIDKDNYDAFKDSLQAGPLLFAAPTGTPADLDLLQIWVKDNGTARALTYNAVFAAGDGETLPGTTTVSKWLVMLFQWNSTSNKWYLLTSKIFAP